MINGHDFYMVLSTMMPLYVPLILAYSSVRWWKIFTPDQCAGINRFVAVYAIPFLCFNLISKNDPYTMNWKFIAADMLQKIIVIVALILWAKFSKFGSFDWTITIFSLSTLPNNLVIGIPLLVAMYGDYCKSLMVQIVVLQCTIWGFLYLLLLEYRAAKMLIMKQFPNAAGSIASLKVEPDVVSLDGNQCLETDTTITDDGKLHIIIRKSNASRSRSSPVATPRPSNFSGVEIYCPNTSPRTSNFSEALAADIMYSSPSTKFDLRAKEVKLSFSDSVGGNPEKQVTPTGSTAGLYVVGVSKSGTEKHMPPTSVMTRMIMMMVWRKLIRNPNIYSTFFGAIWSLIQFRWNFETPIILDKSITILSDTGLGMAMFALGAFMGLQSSLLPCGKAQATYAMVARFIIGPAVMSVASIIVGIRKDLLRVAIVQAALPQASTPFVFANVYNVHPQILCTSVIFSMVIAVPVTLIYYVVLGL